MSELEVQVRDYFDHIAPPTDIDLLVERFDEEAPALSPGIPRRRLTGMWVAAVAAAVVVLVIGAVAVLQLLGGQESPPVTEPVPTPTVTSPAPTLSPITTEVQTPQPTPPPEPDTGEAPQLPPSDSLVEVGLPTNWSLVASGPESELVDVIRFGSEVLAAGWVDTGEVWISPDGLSWSAVEGPFSGFTVIEGLTVGGPGVVAVGSTAGSDGFIKAAV